VNIPESIALIAKIEALFIISFPLLFFATTNELRKWKGMLGAKRVGRFRSRQAIDSGKVQQS
jgi:hypothetical protein